MAEHLPGIRIYQWNLLKDKTCGVDVQTKEVILFTMKFYFVTLIVVKHQ